MFDQITPIILTRNEEPNIERTLGRLSWARDIVIVDSYSDDQTVNLAARFPQTRVIQRAFDTHAGQWDFGLNQTGITTEWVLALDADYVLSEALITEIGSLKPDHETSGYRAPFVYLVHGHALRGSAYPPVTVLYRRARARYVQDGHTQRVSVNGRVETLRGHVLHDDRKSLSRWIQSQRVYMKLEAEKLAGVKWVELGWKDKLRKLKIVAPVAMGLYCLLVKRALLDGRFGLYYSLQRVLSEVLLSLYLIEAEQDRVEQVQGQGVEATQVP